MKIQHFPTGFHEDEQWQKLICSIICSDGPGDFKRRVEDTNKLRKRAGYVNKEFIRMSAKKLGLSKEELSEILKHEQKIL